jgi:predicted transporter
MSNCPLCNLEPMATSGGKSGRLGPLRRVWRSTKWLFPAALLAVMPKCPICLAAYIALCTGVGVSVSTARWIQILMLVLCLCSLTYFAVRFCRWLAKRRAGWIASSLGWAR